MVVSYDYEMFSPIILIYCSFLSFSNMCGQVSFEMLSNMSVSHTRLRIFQELLNWEEIRVEQTKH